MSKPEFNIDDLFAKSNLNLDFHPSEEDWLSIKDQVVSKKKKRRGFFWWFIGTGAVLITLGLFSLFGEDKRPVNRARVDVAVPNDVVSESIDPQRSVEADVQSEEKDSVEPTSNINALGSNQNKNPKAEVVSTLENIKSYNSANDNELKKIVLKPVPIAGIKRNHLEVGHYNIAIPVLQNNSKTAEINQVASLAPCALEWSDYSGQRMSLIKPRNLSTRSWFVQLNSSIDGDNKNIFAGISSKKSDFRYRVGLTYQYHRLNDRIVDKKTQDVYTFALSRSVASLSIDNIHYTGLKMDAGYRIIDKIYGVVGFSGLYRLNAQGERTMHVANTNKVVEKINVENKYTKDINLSLKSMLEYNFSNLAFGVGYEYFMYSGLKNSYQESTSNNSRYFASLTYHF